MKLKAAFTPVVGLILLLTPLTSAAQATASAGIGPLSDPPAWTGEGTLANETFGFSVAAAGDVNGDGYTDVIVGAPSSQDDLDEGGRAYVYLGSANGLADSPAWIAESDQAGARFGWSVSTAGDVNGDGYSDVIVGAPFDYNAQDEGRAYVYLGAASGLADSPAWVAEIDQAGACFGFSVGTAGDVNGDGYSDVIVGAETYSGTYPLSGQAYVYLGSASGLASSPAWAVDSDQFVVFFGHAVGTAGDVNGDGYDDVVVGAYGGGYDGSGQAYVYLGSATGLATSPAWVAEGDQADALLGWSAGTAGDVNGDGYDDVIVGAPTSGDNLEGRVYVYLGSATGLAANPAWIVEGNQDWAEFGVSLGTAGDVNDDGYGDVIVAGYDRDGGWTYECGRAYVYLGSADGLAWYPSWLSECGRFSGGFDGSLGTAGDVNGDGYSDVIVGAPGAGTGGRAYVYLGAPYYCAYLPIVTWQQGSPD